ncbi:MAG: AMP-binding protein [Halioglobus sp.]
MEKHYASIWESIADVIGDQEALVHGQNRRTWSEYDNRSARLAQALLESGLGPNSKVGLYLYNSNEYMEAQYASMKIRGVPININYRYLDDELLYLLDNSDAEALVFHSSLGDRVARVMERADKVRLWIQVDDGGESVPGAVDYEELVTAHDPADRITRSADDLYMLYTGGTTGMPKGVMYDTGAMVQFFISRFPILGLEIPEPKDVASVVKAAYDEGRSVSSIPACPLMHGTGMWLGAMMPHLAGGKVVTLPSRSLDADELWQSAQDEAITQLVIVGDAFAKPMIKALQGAQSAGRPYDLSRIDLVLSSGVMWTTEVKQALLEWHEFVLIDAMGSTEGSMGMQVTTRGSVGETARFTKGEDTKVFTEDGREVEPGSGEAGMVAAGGTVPRGYYKDSEKSAATFKTIEGVRYSFPGDWALVEGDGSLTLLGRGSNCINTAGEKVYPEEVEEVVKQHPDVVDCLVVGIDDEKFGQRVTGVASLIPDSECDAETLREFTRTKLAAYKIPKQIVIVDQVKRAPNGKADYKWARNEIERH